jgi:hypothetical protein
LDLRIPPRNYQPSKTPPHSPRVTATANRLIVAPDERSLQIDLVRLDRTVPVRAALKAEILVLRHQLNVLRRNSPKRLAFGNFLWLNLQPEEFRLRGYLSQHSRSAFSTTSLLGSTRGKYSLSPVCKPTRIEK